MSQTIIFHQLFAIGIDDDVHFAELLPHKNEFQTMCGKSVKTGYAKQAKKIHGKGTCWNCAFEASVKKPDEPVKRWRA